MQCIAADQLNVIVPHIEDTFAGFTRDGESLREDVVYSRAVRETLFESEVFA
jgi:hypothetical protein